MTHSHFDNDLVSVLDLQMGFTKADNFKPKHITPGFTWNGPKDYDRSSGLFDKPHSAHHDFERRFCSDTAKLGYWLAYRTGQMYVNDIERI
jgi:hypothetical protein